MRVILDTNVLVSAFISKRGNSANVLDLLTTFEEITLVLSEQILEEFSDVMRREEVKQRFAYSEGDIKQFTDTIRRVATIVRPRSSFKVVKTDPKDDMVLNAAYDGNVDYVVSGDRHLKDVRRFRGIRIVSPTQFVRIVTRRFGELIISEKDLK